MHFSRLRKPRHHPGYLPMLKKLIRRGLNFLLILFLLTFLLYCWTYFPIISGYAAQATCSAVFVSGRNPNDIKKQDFYRFPFCLASVEVNIHDSSVSASIFCLAGRKAIYRQELGATLINGITEGQLRSQRFALAAPPEALQDTLPWPRGERLTGTLPVDIDTAKLKAAEDAAFFDSARNEEWGTRAFVVVYKGQIVAEKYAAGFTSQMPLLGWSMTKSVMNALTGILVKQKRLNICDPVAVPEWQKDERRNITGFLMISCSIK